MLLRTSLYKLGCSKGNGCEGYMGMTNNAKPIILPTKMVTMHMERSWTSARQHNANAMCTLILTSGTCPKTCGNGQGALAQVFRALAHDYWPTYPNKIDQSRCLKRVHLHFNLPLPPVYSHPRTDHYTYICCHTMPPRTNKKTLAKKDGKAK